MIAFCLCQSILSAKTTCMVVTVDVLVYTSFKEYFVAS